MSAAPRERVLLLPLTLKDGATTQALLRTQHIRSEVCADFDEMMRKLAAGAGVLVIAEERMTRSYSDRLAAAVRDQPAWSDLPVLFLTREGADSLAARDAVCHFGNVTLLERPLRMSTLISAVQSAMRARRRQYQIRGHLEERERATEALRAADRRKDEFLATLGHELRNPLAPLITGLHMLRLSAGDNPALGNMMDVMERQITHLVRLVDDLLEVSRITRGVIDVQRDPVDIVPLLRSAIETTRSMFDGAGHELEVELPDEPIVVHGDGVRLTQVFANLLANAAKYTNNGGRISLSVRSAPRLVRGRNDTARAMAVISLRDNGIGIPKEHLASVFEMFMQVDRSSRRAQGGLGIGLTLVRSLVEMHGGSVEAFSDGPGKGSEFVVKLPVLTAAAAVARSAETRPAEAPAFPARRILVVDDNHDAADMLGTLLATLGATIEVVHSGQAALAVLPRFAPDTVLLDIGMPEIDGYEVARRIRAEPKFASILLVALTGWGQDQDFERSRAAGFDHHLVKPPKLEELRSVLAQGSAGEEPHTDASRLLRPRHPRSAEEKRLHRPRV